MVMKRERFEATVEGRRNGGIAIRIPFDPDASWGEKDRHYVSGSIHGMPFRGRLVQHGVDPYIELGPSWCRAGVVTAGDRVGVIIAPEGPQFDDLPADFRDALAADPAARRSFESLATFYRNGYVRSIDDARRPDTRARRIGETLEALRPRQDAN
jgi:hypothetical protein